MMSVKNKVIPKNTIIWVLEPNEERFIHFKIINESPFSIKLDIYSTLFYNTSYSDEIIRPDDIIWVWINVLNYHDNRMRCKITIYGERA